MKRRDFLAATASTAATPDVFIMYGVNHPDKSRSAGEPIGHLGECLSRAITRGENFDGEIGREGGKRHRWWIRKALALHERHIGPAHSIGIAGEVKACIAGHDEPQGVGPDVIVEQGR